MVAISFSPLDIVTIFVNFHFPLFFALSRFDINGMVLGISLLLFSLFLSGLGLSSSPLFEVAVSLLLMIFQCCLLSFSNSYIIAEQGIIMFMITTICIVISFRLILISSTATSKSGCIVEKVAIEVIPSMSWELCLPMVVASCSRMNEIFVSGHGMDPSIRAHTAHHPVAFIGSLALLAFVRLKMTSPTGTENALNMADFIGAMLDVLSLFFLAMGWWEKWAENHNRKGFLSLRAAMIISILGIIKSIWIMLHSSSRNRRWGQYTTKNLFHEINISLFRCMIFTIAVTGPSSAGSAVLFVIQVWALREVTLLFKGDEEVNHVSSMKFNFVSTLQHLCVKLPLLF